MRGLFRIIFSLGNKILLPRVTKLRYGDDG